MYVCHTAGTQLDINLVDSLCSRAIRSLQFYVLVYVPLLCHCVCKYTHVDVPLLCHCVYKYTPVDVPLLCHCTYTFTQVNALFIVLFNVSQHAQCSLRSMYTLLG